MAYPQTVINNTMARTIEAMRTMDTPTANKFSRLVTSVLTELGVPLLIYSGTRFYPEQWDLYMTYLAGGFKAAAPGVTVINFMKAGDTVPILPTGKADWNSPLWDQIGSIAKRHGLSWGKSFGDRNHFSNREGASLSALRAANPVPVQYQLNVKPEMRRELDNVTEDNYRWLWTAAKGIGAFLVLRYTYKYVRDSVS